MVPKSEKGGGEHDAGAKAHRWGEGTGGGEDARGWRRSEAPGWVRTAGTSAPAAALMPRANDAERRRAAVALGRASIGLRHPPARTP